MVEVAVTGQVRADGGALVIRRRIDDPARLAGDVFRASLMREGIRIGKKTQTGRATPNAQRLASRTSPPLGDVVREMNKTSDNFLAEVVMKSLGAQRRVASSPRAPTEASWSSPASGSWADGLAAVNDSLVGCGLPAGSFRVGNGSGLFAATAMSANQLTAVLQCADRDFRVGPDLLTSLPTVGADGTLARRLTTSPARARVRAKTGTLAAVSTLAGFAGVDSRRPLVFAILINEIPAGGRPAARQLQDHILERLVAYADATAAQ